MYYINIRQTRQVISRLLITFVNYKLQKHLVEIFCLYTGNLFMKGFCVLYPKIFISEYLLSQNYQKFYFSFLMTQRRPFIRERTIETRIWQKIDYCVMIK